MALTLEVEDEPGIDGTFLDCLRRVVDLLAKRLAAVLRTHMVEGTEPGMAHIGAMV